MALLQTNLRDHIPLLATGKVRELYELDSTRLLFVATDRISAFDVIMANGIDGKGVVLTRLSEFWFRLLPDLVPGLHTHYRSSGVPDQLRRSLPSVALDVSLQKRCLEVKRTKVLPIESIVRGYITGSAWSSYRESGTVCDIPLPPGLQESEKLERPLWTPSTKADVGGVDQNISPARAAEIIGKAIAEHVERLSIQIYEKANDYAAQRGIIIADTKFEFGLDETTSPPTLTLIDEVLTPDSSRFWPADRYELGRAQDSFDKQALRDWLTQTHQRGKAGVVMPEEIISDTLNRYRAAYTQLVGTRWDE